MAKVRSGRAASRVLPEQREALRRWVNAGDRSLLAVLVVLTLAIAVAMYVRPNAVTGSLLLAPLMLAGLTLGPRTIPGFLVFLLAVLAVETVVEQGSDVLPRRWVTIVAVVSMSAVTWLIAARQRGGLGVGGLRSDAMLKDLQQRISRQGELPPLPPSWYVDLAVRSAEGTPFSGDFLVAQPDAGGCPLSLVLVDVSGKGIDAGPRSLLLSGALGGLLGALPPEDFMGAANGFLIRQRWSEGFATAVHLCLDMATGDFELRAAGHPPPAQFMANAGRWHVHDDATGPALGLLETAEYTCARGRMGRGDVLLLYTDGLVERTRRDISLGLDKLLGAAERLVSRGFEGAAPFLVERVGSTADDCALVLVHRR